VGNVILENEEREPTFRAAWGISTLNLSEVVLTDNIIANARVTTNWGFGIHVTENADDADIQLRRNIVYNFPGGLITSIEAKGKLPRSVVVDGNIVHNFDNQNALLTHQTLSIPWDRFSYGRNIFFNPNRNPQSLFIGSDLCQIMSNPLTTGSRFFVSGLRSQVDDLYNGALFGMRTGPHAGTVGPNSIGPYAIRVDRVYPVLDYVGQTGEVRVSWGFPTAPTAGELCVIYGGSGMSFARYQQLFADSTSEYRQVPFPDPTRNLESYHASLGRPANYDLFFAELMKQTPWLMRPEYRISTVLNYIKAGFGCNASGCNFRG
jgi:hypothetical protein